ncbi:MAG: aldo/keto reductase [Polyangiaceae bacterium]|nr:aldo/keto reductase [Polyangiaceae bacterium]
MSGFDAPVRLGRTDLTVKRLGLAASYGATDKDVERAFERGIDFFYWGSARRPAFGAGLKRLGARARSRLTVVVQSYARSSRSIGRSLESALRELAFDHADVLLLGWWNLPPSDAILDAARELVHRGRARAVMVSCHHRPTFAKLARDPRIDLLMLRYNAAHPGAERDVFPLLPAARPGMVAYTATSWGQLVDPRYLPPGERLPTGSDCYRYVLSSPFVDACWSGPKNAAELDEALRALELGPLAEDELAWLRRVGVKVRAEATTRGRGMDFADRLVNLWSGFGFRTTRELPRD